MINMIIIINFCILCFFIFSLISYTIFLISSIPEIIAHYRLSNYSNIYSFINHKRLPPVTVIIPIYNVEKTVNDAIWSVLKAKYPNLYVIAIMDGDSEDNTVEKLFTTFAFEEVGVIVEEKIKTAPIRHSYVSKTNPNLMLIDKEHRGPGDTLNVGLNVCFTPYVMTMDADSIMEPDTVSEMIHYLITHEHVFAVGGGVYLLNNCKYEKGRMVEPRLPQHWVAALQNNEYMRSHLFNRTSWNRFGGTMSYSGTATLFYRQTLLDLNGFDTHNFAQDAEIIIKLHEHLRRNKIDYQIGFTPTATVWTLVPDTLRAYTKQQNHWRRGLLRSTLRYWYMFLNPRYKIQGLLGYPLYMLLEIMAPYVEFTAYFTVLLAYYLGMLNGMSVLLYMILAWGFSSYLTIANAFINLITFNRYHNFNDILKILGLTFMDMLGFRQYLTGVKVWATLQYFFNRLIGRPQ
ncbi:TPA: glycosyltransferase [Legionella feeleii]